MSPSDAFAVAQHTLVALLPEVLIILVATTMMTAGAFVQLPRRVWSLIAAGTLLAALVALAAVWSVAPDAYAAVAVNDPMSGYCRVAFLFTGLIILGMAHDQVDDSRAAEFFGAILMMHAGSMLVAAANELVFLFAGLELVSLPTYLLLYLPRRNATTQEAATKYFYLSILSSAISLFGLAYLYGIGGVSNLKALSYLVHWKSGELAVAPVGMGLVAVVFILAGFGFRCAAVPFHFYAPDVYQGSPTVITAILAWIPKAVGFLAILRTVTAVFGQTAGPGLDHPLAERAAFVAMVIAVVTMVLGNTVALAQENLKRLLAYSSIAHAGYLMVGVAAAFRNGPNAAFPDPAVGETVVGYLGGQGVLFYLASYALMTLGVFGVILLLSTPERPIETIEELSGLSRTRPFVAFAMAICLFSLAGVPPLAGFWGKLYIFASAWPGGASNDAGRFQLLVVLAVLNAAVGAYYYLRIVVKMYLQVPIEKIESRPAWPTVWAVATCAALTVLIGLFSDPLTFATREAARHAIDTPAPGLRATAGLEKAASHAVSMRAGAEQAR
jgi:NADH-quinone oxidoreductase subunit N